MLMLRRCWLKGECFWEKVEDDPEEGKGKEGKGKETAEGGALAQDQTGQQLERRKVPVGPGTAALPLKELVGGHSKQVGDGRVLGTPVRQVSERPAGQVSGRPVGKVPRRPTMQIRDRPVVRNLGPPPPTGVVPWGKTSPVIWGEGVNRRRDLEFSRMPVRPGKVRVVGGKKAADKA